MEPEFCHASVVLVGKLTLDDFLPEAMARAKIISQKDSKAAQYLTLLPGAVIKYKLTWAEITVEPERLIITTDRPPYVRISDLVTKALYEFRTAPVVTAFGINLECHYRLADMETRDALGKRLAPPQEWGEWGAKIEEAMHNPGPTHSGMSLVQMRYRFADDKLVGWRDVSVGPSPRIEGSGGVLFRTNHHHQSANTTADEDKHLERQDDKRNGMFLVDALAERFDASIAEAESIFRGVLGKQ